MLTTIKVILLTWCLSDGVPELGVVMRAAYRTSTRNTGISFFRSYCARMLVPMPGTSYTVLGTCDDGLLS